MRAVSGSLLAKAPAAGALHPALAGLMRALCLDGCFGLEPKPFQLLPSIDATPATATRLSRPSSGDFGGYRGVASL